LTSFETTAILNSSCVQPLFLIVIVFKLCYFWNTFLTYVNFSKLLLNCVRITKDSNVFSMEFFFFFASMTLIEKIWSRIYWNMSDNFGLQLPRQRSKTHVVTSFIMPCFSTFISIVVYQTLFVIAVQPCFLIFLASN